MSLSVVNLGHFESHTGPWRQDCLKGNPHGVLQDCTAVFMPVVVWESNYILPGQNISLFPVCFQNTSSASSYCKPGTITQNQIGYKLYIHCVPRPPTLHSIILFIPAHHNKMRPLTYDIIPSFNAARREDMDSHLTRDKTLQCLFFFALNKWVPISLYIFICTIRKLYFQVFKVCLCQSFHIWYISMIFSKILVYGANVPKHSFQNFLSMVTWKAGSFPLLKCLLHPSKFIGITLFNNIIQVPFNYFFTFTSLAFGNKFTKAPWDQGQK